MVNQRRKSTLDQHAARCKRQVRPRVEVLEGRALMATTALDPSFGTGGVVLGPANGSTGTALSAASAVVVQPDGKIVVAGLATPSSFSDISVPSTLVVRRYAANGALDTTFGTDGQANIPLPASYT